MTVVRRLLDKELEEGADLLLVSHLLGHESIRTRAIYARVTPPKQRERLAE